MPPVPGAGGPALVRVVCVVPVRCLCAGGCVAVQCVRWCCGALCCRPSSAPLCPPLLRYLLALCLPWLVAVPPCPRASLAWLLATLLLPALLGRSLPFPLLSVGLPSSLACIFLCLACVLVCDSVFPFAYFLALRVLLLLSFLVLWKNGRMGVWAIAGVAVLTMT